MYMVIKNNIFENLGLKEGTNSMTPRQVKQLGTILPKQNTINLLEFGAGKTTTLLFNALKTYYDKVTYVTYETNPFYVPTIKEIDVRMHTKEDLIQSNLKIPKDEKFDIIIVDGPDGELRKYWFSLFVNNVKNNTIIHIDDAFHFPSFENEFKKHFPDSEYLFEHGRNLNINKCWITAKIKK